MTNSPHADNARERAERTGREQADLSNSTGARLNNALINVCVGFLLGGLVGIIFTGLFLRWGWGGVLVGGLSWIIASAFVIALAIAQAPKAH